MTATAAALRIAPEPAEAQRSDVRGPRSDVPDLGPRTADRGPERRRDAEAHATTVTRKPRRETKAGTLGLHAWVVAYMKQTGIKKHALAEQIGYSRSAVSKWIDGTYDAEDQTAIEQAFQALRDRIEGPGGLSSFVGFRETTTSLAIFGALKLAADGNLIILVGESGAGKSEAIKEAIRRASSGKKSIPAYIEGTVFTSGYALVAALAREIGVEQRGNPDALMRAIADKLRREPRIIILDEAHYAQERAIEALRQIRDMAGVGVIILGTTMFAGIPIGKLGQADLMHELLLHRPHLEQVVSRAIIIPIPGLDSEEAESIARDVLGAWKPEAMERLLERTGESMRRFVRIVDQIKKARESRGSTGAVTVDDVDHAWKRLYPPHRGRA